MNSGQLAASFFISFRGVLFMIKTKCKACKYRDSNGYDLCPVCYKLFKNKRVFPTRTGWKQIEDGQIAIPDKIYTARKSLITPTEDQFGIAIAAALPVDYCLFPQVALSAVVCKEVSEFGYQNELYRVLDFLVTDKNYKPVLAIEINDASHYTDNQRRQRDITVRRICEEAGIPLLVFSTAYEVPSFEDMRRKLNVGIAQAKNGLYEPYIYKIVNLPKTEIPSPQQIQPQLDEQLNPKENSVPNAPAQVYKSFPLQLYSHRNWSTMVLLTVFLGWLGAHRLYARRIGLEVLYFLVLAALLQLSSVYVLWIIIGWWFSDFILVITGHYTDKDGYRIQKGVPH